MKIIRLIEHIKPKECFGLIFNDCDSLKIPKIIENIPDIDRIKISVVIILIKFYCSV